MAPTDHTRRPSAGFSLLSTMIAVGIAGIVALVMAVTLSKAASMLSYFDRRQDIQELKRAATRVSCTKTLAPLTVCTDGNLYSLKRSDGLAVGVAGGEPGVFKLGKAVFRAQCVSGALIVEVPGLNPAGYAKDSTGKYTNWQSIYGAGTTGLCSNSAGWKPISEDCVFQQQVFTHPGTDNSFWRSLSIDCPATHPTAMAVNVRPSCNARGWQSQFIVSGTGFPTGAGCSNFFWEDLHPSTNPTYTVAQYQALQNVCYNPNPGNGGNFACQVTCCK